MDFASAVHAAKEKLAQVDGTIQRREAVNLAMPTFATIAGRNTAADPVDDGAAE